MQTTADQTRIPATGAAAEGSRKAQAFFTLGMRAVHRGDISDAVALFREAVTCAPDFVDAHYNLARALKDMGDLRSAAESFRHVLELQPGDPDAWYTLGNTYAAMDEPGKAEGCYRTALSLRPQEVGTYNNLAVTLQALGRTDEAEAVAAVGIAIDPACADLHYNRALALLLDGALAEGWKEFEWRFLTSDRANPLRSRNVPRWTGSELTGRRILLASEQGFGDMIQFVRFAPHLHERGASVLLECPRELAGLLAGAPGVDGIVLPDTVPPEHDFWTPLLSLPHMLGVHDEHILGRMVPYLAADPGREAAWRGRVPRRGTEPVIGFSWSGNPRHRNDHHRSCPPEQFAALLSLRGTHWYRLDIGPESDPARVGQRGIIDHTRHIADFSDTAAFISALDLVITVDTSIAHLAGALGKPTWVLLPFAPDWRWMTKRPDTPWYPGMRLFRQERRGDWEGVVRRVMETLGREYGPFTVEAPPVIVPGGTLSPGAGSATHRPGPPANKGYAPITMEHADSLLRAGDFEHAIDAYEHLIRLHDGPVGAWNNLGVSLQQSGKLKRAIAAFERAVDLEPHSAAVLSNLGFALLEEGETERAEATLQKALRSDPTLAEARNNLGNVFLVQGRHHDAIEAYRSAVSCRGDFAEAHWNLAQVLLQTGDFSAGWREYEWRWRRQDFTSPRRAFEQPLWSGEDFRGRTLLLHAEQGYGDALQFIRYVDQISAKGGRILIECQPALERLFRQSLNVEQVIPYGSALPPFDLHLPLMSLPRVLETTLENVPAVVPYLVSDSDERAWWRKRLADPTSALSLGIVWSGTQSLKALQNRRCPLSALEKLFSLEGVRFFSLQMGTAANEVEDLTPPVRLRDLTPDIKDFAETAAAVEALDLLVTVDTAMAHLAGALGKPVWVLLPKHADWRWMLGRNDSPWYPTMRLFRQTECGRWDSVIRAITSELRGLCRQGGEQGS